MFILLIVLVDKRETAAGGAESAKATEKLTDALPALVVFVGTRLAFAIPAFAVLNVIIVGVWLAVVAGIAREHKRLSTEA